MDKKQALESIQHMHETKTVTRDSIFGWYHFYSHKLPKRKPERSDVDLIRTIALWMELTDKGGSPGFPYKYKSDIEISFDETVPTKPSIAFPIGILTSLGGVIVLFFNLVLGIVLIIAGQVIIYAGYKLRGGATNPDILKDNSLLYRQEGKRVIEWIHSQS
jgi:hypothetical protein